MRRGYALAEAVRQYLEEQGPCPAAESPDSDDPTCDDRGCNYCRMAAAWGDYERQG